MSNIPNSFTTAKGTVLPLLNLKGKAYLQVAHRLVWFREEKPDWSIYVEFLILQEDHTIAKATIKDESGRLISVSHKREDAKHFQDHTEKAETGAIGRALALIGFGTQFAPELDEGERIVDSPMTPAQVAQRAAQETMPAAQDAPECCGKKMYVSQYVDQKLGHKPWYCSGCKKKVARE